MTDVEDRRAARLDVRRPFTRAQAVAAGISPGALRGSSFQHIFRNVYIHASVPLTALIVIEAALLIHPRGAFASHASAARGYELPLPTLPDQHITVFAEKDRRRRPGIRHHVVAPGRKIVRVRGIPVSAPEDLFVELSEILGLVDLVVVGDAMVRAKLTTPSALVARCAKARAATRRAAALVRDQVDSPMETRLRLLIVLAGLPEPTINYKVYRDNGTTAPCATAST